MDTRSRIPAASRTRREAVYTGLLTYRTYRRRALRCRTPVPALRAQRRMRRPSQTADSLFSMGTETRRFGNGGRGLRADAKSGEFACACAADSEVRCITNGEGLGNQKRGGNEAGGNVEKAEQKLKARSFNSCATTNIKIKLTTSPNEHRTRKRSRSRKVFSYFRFVQPACVSHQSSRH